MKFKTVSKSLSFLALGSSILMTSCATEAPWSSGDKEDGKILLTLSTDGSVSEGTRADNECPLIPGSSEFAISLESTDGSYKNSWSSLDAFNNESGFPMGSYNIAASFGNLDSEGFTNPFFYGESTVNVSLGQTSAVNITTTLCNTMLSVRYSDQFGQFFSSYSASVQTEGHDPVVFVQNETRPAFVSPGHINLKLTLTKEGGNTITISPTEFDADPKKHYIVTFGVEGNIDSQAATLTVEWSEEVVEETREIFLTDELFTAPAPTISTLGYDEKGLSLFESVEYPDINPEFHIFAFGGLSKATLKISAENGGIVPPCGESVNLVNADATTQANLKSSGIDCAGLFKNPGDMAVVNFKEFVRNLNPGTYKVTLEVEDSLGRTEAIEDAAVLIVSIEGIKYEFAGYEKPDFLGNELIVKIATNCDLAKNQFRFQALDGNGEFKDVKSEFINEETPEESSDMPYVYTYKLSSDKITDSIWRANVKLASKAQKEQELDVNMPEFTIEKDPFAKKVKFRITSSNSDKWSSEELVEIAKIYKGNKIISQGNVRDPENRIITVTTDGTNTLNPNTPYDDYTISFGNSLYQAYLNNVGSFTTEDNIDVPNGNFERTSETINISNVQVGGEWAVTQLRRWTTTSSIKINEAVDWASVNELTCFQGSSNKNTWYMVPSTYVENSDCVIRTVGYNNKGESIPFTSRSASTDYYCPNPPKDGQLIKKVGELFLGSYSYDGTNENRNEGIDFTSRPQKLVMNYSYTAKNNEKASIYVRIYDVTGKIIAQIEKSLENQLESKEIKIDFGEYEFNSKAHKIEAKFISSDNETDPYIYIPTGSELKEDGINTGNYTTERARTLDANTYHAVATGSELRISNVHLEY